MRKMHHLGTFVLCGISGICCLIVLLVTGNYLLRRAGWQENKISSWLLQNASVNMDFLNEMAKEYPVSDNVIEQYVVLVKNMEGVIENLCTSSFPGNSNIKKLVDNYKRHIMRNDIEMIPYGDAAPVHIEEAADYVMDFNNFCLSKNLNFLYVQLPGNARRDALKLGNKNEMEVNYSDLFQDLLLTKGVPLLSITSDEKKVIKMEYDASGHWLPENALEVSKVIAEKLNAGYGFSFDTDMFEKSEYYNVLKNRTDISKKIEDDYGYNYEFFVPRNAFLYDVIINEKETYRGTFTEAVLTPQEEWDCRVNENTAIAYHNMLKITNMSLVTIQNESTVSNAGKSILLLGDSFTWPITVYLSQGVGQITTLNPGYFSGNIRSYIEKNKFDLVIFMYYDGEINYSNRVSKMYGVVGEKKIW